MHDLTPAAIADIRRIPFAPGPEWLVYLRNPATNVQIDVSNLVVADSVALIENRIENDYAEFTVADVQFRLDDPPTILSGNVEIRVFEEFVAACLTAGNRCEVTLNVRAASTRSGIVSDFCQTFFGYIGRGDIQRQPQDAPTVVYARGYLDKLSMFSTSRWLGYTGVQRLSDVCAQLALMWRTEPGQTTDVLSIDQSIGLIPTHDGRYTKSSWHINHNRGGDVFVLRESRNDWEIIRWDATYGELWWEVIERATLNVFRAERLLTQARVGKVRFHRLPTQGTVAVVLSEYLDSWWHAVGEDVPRMAHPLRIAVIRYELAGSPMYPPQVVGGWNVGYTKDITSGGYVWHPTSYLEFDPVNDDMVVAYATRETSPGGAWTFQERTLLARVTYANLTNDAAATDWSVLAGYFPWGCGGSVLVPGPGGGRRLYLQLATQVGTVVWTVVAGFWGRTNSTGWGFISASTIEVSVSNPDRRWEWSLMAGRFGILQHNDADAYPALFRLCVRPLMLDVQQMQWTTFYSDDYETQWDVNGRSASIVVSVGRILGAPLLRRAWWIHDSPAAAMPVENEITIDLDGDPTSADYEVGYYWLARKHQGRGDHALIGYTLGQAGYLTVLLDVQFMPQVDMTDAQYEDWSYRDLVRWVSEATGHFISFTRRDRIGGLSSVRMVVRSRQCGVPLYTLTADDVMDDILITGPEEVRVILTTHGVTYRKGTEAKTARELTISNEGVPAAIAEDVAEWLAFDVFGDYRMRVVATGDLTIWVECGDYVEIATEGGLVQGIVVRAANQMQAGKWGSVALEVYGIRIDGSVGLNVDARYVPRGLEV